MKHGLGVLYGKVARLLETSWGMQSPARRWRGRMNSRQVARLLRAAISLKQRHLDGKISAHGYAVVRF